MSSEENALLRWDIETFGDNGWCEANHLWCVLSMPRNTVFMPDFNEVVVMEASWLFGCLVQLPFPLPAWERSEQNILERSFGSLDIIARGGMAKEKHHHLVTATTNHYQKWWTKMRLSEFDSKKVWWVWCSMSPKEFKNNTLHLRYSCPLLFFFSLEFQAVSKAKM